MFSLTDYVKQRSETGTKNKIYEKKSYLKPCGHFVSQLQQV
jgi:hypothetical protein